MEKSSVEQQFRKSDAVSFVVWTIWNHTPSASGFYSRLAVRQNSGRFQNLEISLQIASLGFSRSLTKVQRYNITNGF